MSKCLLLAPCFTGLKGLSHRLYRSPSQQHLWGRQRVGVIYLHFDDEDTETLGGISDVPTLCKVSLSGHIYNSSFWLPSQYVSHCSLVPPRTWCAYRNHLDFTSPRCDPIRLKNPVTCRIKTSSSTWRVRPSCLPLAHLFGLLSCMPSFYFLC